MIDTSLENLQIDDIDKLDGIGLSMALGIHCLNWKWYSFSSKKDEYRKILLDCPPDKEKIVSEDYGAYICDNRWIFIQYPKYHESLSWIFVISTIVFKKYKNSKNIFSKFLTEIVGEDIVNISTANAKSKGKALLKTVLYYKQQEKISEEI